MCGVIACRTDGPVVDYLLAALHRLEYRGYDSAGIAATTVAGDIATVRAVGRVGVLDRRLRQWAGPAFGSVGVGHTRWATHGAVTEANAHPHSDCSGQLSLVHNGIITNAEQLRDVLTAAGHVFATAVDSEVLVHLIEEHRRHCGDLFEAVRAALAHVHGSWGLAVLDQRRGTIVVAAQDSPLVIARTGHGDFATSDVTAVADWADEFRVLEDGDVVELNGSNRWSHRGSAARTPIVARYTGHPSDTTLNGYSDFMAKEIDEQPEAVARLLDRLGDGMATAGLWSDLGLPPFGCLEIIGCGTSLNAGRVIATMAHRLGGVPVHVSVASEAAAELPAGPGTLRLAISQSGETADVLHAVNSIGAENVSLLALTNNPHSTLVRRADAAVMCAAGTEIGVAATKTFVCQIVAGAALMISALVASERISADVATGLADQLRRMPERLALAATVAKCLVPPIAEQLTAESGFIFIARGTGIPYAAEGALKLKELTYRWAEHCAAGELKHGPLALVTDGTPVVVVANSECGLAANVAEVRARGGRVIDIGPAGSALPVLDGPDLPWGPLAATAPLQIFARTLALALGCDVDKPRNLAKSVTVE